MNSRRNPYFILLAATASMGFAAGAISQSCSPPPGFVDRPLPTLASTDLLASHTEEITVNRGLTVVTNTAARTDIKDAILLARLGLAGWSVSVMDQLSKSRCLIWNRRRTFTGFDIWCGTIRVSRHGQSNMVSASFAIRRLTLRTHISCGPTHSSSRTMSFQAIWAALAVISFIGYFSTGNMRP
jgi:hypothetical protein